MAKLQHNISKEIIICIYSLAKKNSVRFPIYENIKYKNALNKLKREWICLDTWIGKNNARIVKIQHLDSKEIITRTLSQVKSNFIRFPKYYSEQRNLKFQNELNKLNSEWICLKTYTTKNNRLMTQLQHQISKEIIKRRYEHAKKNKVFFPKYEKIKIFDCVNKLGIAANPQYVCVSTNCEKSIWGGTNVSIKRKDGVGKIKTVTYYSLKKGQNPYNESQNRVEVETVQPLYEKLLKRLKINYIKEFNLGRKRIDFMLTLNNKRYGLEVKQSDKFYYSGKNQMATYKKLANLRQYNLEQVILSDPQGKHKNSISIKELEKFIKRVSN